MNASAGPGVDCEHAVELLTEKLTRVRHQIMELQQLQEALEHTIQAHDRHELRASMSVDDCPVMSVPRLPEPARSALRTRLLASEPAYSKQRRASSPRERQAPRFRERLRINSRLTFRQPGRFTLVVPLSR